ncbi:transglutaminase-like superfamily protein [Clostridium sporogenes]|uniref:immunoglobulin-like domain-containing protein n=1 Tax=Clostridium TaxID=1485 RepID=UPI00090AA294|nr:MULTISPECIES: immunoglobulin-like domain-containing protein [Clostridium]APF25552.1 transglutaminase-like superfamily protein [Clostridium sporogenes]MDI6921837.1 cell wall-binding repeat-containing protein [Clostridium botulinum]WMU98082.1 cell wall-binding repeat-containing protein [Clostridium botulinum]
MKKFKRALASSTILALVLQTNIVGGNVKAYDGQVKRFEGNNRYETAAKLATFNWTKSDNIVLVSGEGYADALSASVLAKRLNAPIILTNPNNLNDNARQTIEKLKAKNIYVIGGEASISSKIRNGLKDNYKLIELKGKDRFETNLNVAEEMVKLGVDTSEVMVVNGKDGFSDALSAAPIAAANGQILLIVSKDNGKTATEFIQKHNSKATVIGTRNVVSDKIYNSLGASRRVDGGANRFETNLKILKEFNVKSDTHLYIANSTGKGYADALVASVLAGKFNAPLILTDTKDSKDTEKALKYIKDNIKGTTEINAVGGKSVIPESVTENINKYIEKKPDSKPDVKPDSKPDVKPDPKPDVKPKPENKAPIATGTLNKSSYNINKDKSEITVNLKDLNNDGKQSDAAFVDPDGDKLTYTTIVDGENKDKVEVTVKDNNITVKTKDKFKGQVKITITASDGKKSVSDFFKVNVDNIDNKEEIKTVDANLVQKEKVKLDLGDLNNVIGDLNLPIKGENGVEIAWKSTNVNIVNNTGKVTRPKATEGDAVITLTATLSKGEAKDTKDFVVTVKAKEFTDEELVDISLKDLKLEGNLNSVVDNIKLPTRDEKNKVDIEWRSSNNNILSNAGVVKRTNKDENITLTAVVKRGTVKKNKEFSVVVKANEAKTEDNLKSISDSLKIDNINSIEKDVNLETSLDGANIIWKSNNEAIIDNTGKVKRPNIGQADANVVLTATISKNGKSVTKEFNLKVKALKELVANNKEEFYNIIKDALGKFQTNISIKISNYNDKDYNLDILNQIVLEYPEINYGYSGVTGESSGYQGSSEKTMNLTITYKLDKATMEMEKTAVKVKVQEIIKNVIKEGMSDAEKELALHDYIVKNAEYNIDNYNKGIILAEDHNAYGVLVKGIGVCESYAKAMYELLNAAGIECKYVTGVSVHNGIDGGGHAWNMVKLDNEWYNLDATWDDPVSDRNGVGTLGGNATVNHTYFNIPDSIFSKDHKRGDFEQNYPKCTATKYSYNNMDVDEYTVDGKLIKKVTTKDELDAEILKALKEKNSALSLRIKGFKMTQSELSAELEKVANNNSVGALKWMTSSPDEYHVNYTIQWTN